MNNYHRYIAVSCIVLGASAAISSFAQKNSLSVVELLGEKYYVYKAKKGDSLFGIARTFGWDDNKLAELNPSAVSPLKKGMLIYYPTGEKVDVNEAAREIFSEQSELHHDVKRGETVYSIAKMYNMPVERLYTLNPSSRNGIKAGESLLIRKADAVNTADNSKKPVFYSVKSGDTLYALAQRFGVTVESIMQNNPGVDESNFRAGSTVKIPVRGTGVQMVTKTLEKSNIDSVVIHKAGKNDTWQSLANENGVSEKVLKEANPELKKPKKNEYIAVPKVETVTVEETVVAEDPRETSDDGISEIYDEVHKVSAASGSDAFTAKIAVIVDDESSKKDREFIRGFITGIDRQKNSGYKIDFKAIPASQSEADVIAQLKDFAPTMVFTTSEHRLADYVANYAEESRTPVVNTFDVKSNTYVNNPYVIQLLTPPALFNDNVAHYANKRFGDRTLIFVGDEDKNDQLAESLYAVWDSSKIKSLASLDNLIPEMLNENGKYLIYSFETKKAEVSQVLEKVAALKEQMPLADISMLGRPNLIVYEGSMEPMFKKASLSIPSRFYIEKESHASREFNQRYKALFNSVPVKSLPLYAAVGYDASCYFIPALADSQGDINKLKPSSHTVQSDFDLYRTSNWSGFLNPPVYVIDYTPVGVVQKNVVSHDD